MLIAVFGCPAVKLNDAFAKLNGSGGFSFEGPKTFARQEHSNPVRTICNGICLRSLAPDSMTTKYKPLITLRQKPNERR